MQVQLEIQGLVCVSLDTSKLPPIPHCQSQHHHNLLKAETYSLESKPREIWCSVISTKGVNTISEGEIK